MDQRINTECSPLLLTHLMLNLCYDKSNKTSSSCSFSALEFDNEDTSSMQGGVGMINDVYTERLFNQTVADRLSAHTF